MGKKPMSNEQIKEIAEIIAELHKYGVEIPIATDAIKEEFDVPFCRELKVILSSLDHSQTNEAETILKLFEETLLKTLTK